MKKINSQFNRRKKHLKSLWKKIVSITITSAFMTSIVSAANIPTWTGFYIGPEIGGIVNNIDIDSHHLGFTSFSGACNNNTTFPNFVFGGQAGFAYQFDSQIVIGIEASFTGIIRNSHTFSCTCPTDTFVSDQFTLKNRWQSAIKGRFGVALENGMLPFILFGGNFTNLNLEYRNEGGDHYSHQKTRAAWLLGVGFETAISSNWSVSGEYYYAGYNNINLSIPIVYGLFDPTGKAQTDLITNNFLLALNYWF